MRIVCIVIFSMSILNLNLEAQSDSTKTKTTSLAFYPAPASSPETGFMMGVISFLVIKDKESEGKGFYRPTSISPYFLYTAKKQVLTAIDVDAYLKNGLNINGIVRYFNFPDFFYGIGNQTDPEIKELYTDRFFRLTGRVMKPRGKSMFIGLLYDLQHNEIRDVVADGELETSKANGLYGGANMGIGPGMLRDTRNSTLYPTSGSYTNLGVTIFNKALTGAYNYTSILVDYRKYMELLGPKNILALQFRANFTSGDEIPFYKLSKLGGDDRLRGIAHKNLYIDRQSYFLQAEVRQDLFWRFGGVLFAGMGDVAPGIGDFRLRDTRFVVGAGGRFQALKHEKMNIRIDLGITDNGQTAFYMSVREAF